MQIYHIVRCDIKNCKWHITFLRDFWPSFETIKIQILRGFSIHRILERPARGAQRNLSVMIKLWKCLKITANSPWWQIFNFTQQAPTCQIKEAANQHKISLLVFTTWRNKTTNTSWQTIRTIFQQLQAKLEMHQACSKWNKLEPRIVTKTQPRTPAKAAYVGMTGH